MLRARVGNREIGGCDFIHLNDDGRIDELYVMVRPPSGILALAEAMKQSLAPPGTATSAGDGQRR